MNSDCINKLFFPAIPVMCKRGNCGFSTLDVHNPEEKNSSTVAKSPLWPTFVIQHISMAPSGEAVAAIAAAAGDTTTLLLFSPSLVTLQYFLWLYYSNSKAIFLIIPCGGSYCAILTFPSMLLCQIKKKLNRIKQNKAKNS